MATDVGEDRARHLAPGERSTPSTRTKEKSETAVEMTETMV